MINIGLVAKHIIGESCVVFVATNPYDTLMIFFKCGLYNESFFFTEYHIYQLLFSK